MTCIKVKFLVPFEKVCPPFSKYPTHAIIEALISFDFKPTSEHLLQIKLKDGSMSRIFPALIQNYTG
jgi:hypothetical protein